MTAQVNDSCFHRKIVFAVAGVFGDGLFDPEATGIQPVPPSTACWRGYVAHYAISGDELFLTSLHMGLPEDLALRAQSGEGPELFGVLPTLDEYSGFFYEGFQVRMLFTGGLLLVDGFIQKWYVHMGFQSAWKFENVREVIFEAGKLTEDRDRSAEMAAARAKFADDLQQLGDRFGLPADDGIEECSKKCFSHEYRL